MIESALEKKLRDGVKGLGGLCYKFVSPGNAGVPDRVVILPDGRVHFVEVKTEKGRLSKGQTVMQIRMGLHGATVRTLHGLADVEQYIQELTHAHGV